MNKLKSIDLKPFIPAKDFLLSKKFYEAFGFTMTSDVNGVALFHHGTCKFLLQDFYNEEHAKNFMMHFLVEDAYAWHQ